MLSERSLVALPTLKLACLSVPVRVDTHGDQTVIKVVAISSRDRVMIGHPPQRQTLLQELWRSKRLWSVVDHKRFGITISDSLRSDWPITKNIINGIVSGTSWGYVAQSRCSILVFTLSKIEQAHADPFFSLPVSIYIRPPHKHTANHLQGHIPSGHLGFYNAVSNVESRTLQTLTPPFETTNQTIMKENILGDHCFSGCKTEA